MATGGESAAAMNFSIAGRLFMNVRLFPMNNILRCLPAAAVSRAGGEEDKTSFEAARQNAGMINAIMTTGRTIRLILARARIRDFPSVRGNTPLSEGEWNSRNLLRPCCSTSKHLRVEL